MSTPHTCLPTEHDARTFANALSDGLPWDAAINCINPARMSRDLIEGTDLGGYIIAATYLIEHRLDGPFGKPGYTVVTADREAVERFAAALDAELADEDTAAACANGDWQWTLEQAATASGVPLELVLDYAPGCPWAGFVVAGQALVCDADGELVRWLDADELEAWLERRAATRTGEDFELECPECGDASPGLCFDCDQAYDLADEDWHHERIVSYSGDLDMQAAATLAARLTTVLDGEYADDRARIAAVRTDFALAGLVISLDNDLALLVDGKTGRTVLEVAAERDALDHLEAVLSDIAAGER